MEDQFARTRILLGDKAVDRLAQARVAIFGIGGVGGYVCEALARSGVGALDLIDSDKVSLTNINRQIIATHDTLGRYKTEVMRERILSVNPQADVRTYQCFFLPETAEQFSFAQYDYVVDAVDTVTAKIALVLKAEAEKVPIISSMGAGNKLDAGAFQVADIYETKICPLAKVMRRELRKRQVEHLKVVYSQEEPVRLVGDRMDGQEGTIPAKNQNDGTLREEKRRAIPGSVAFVPSVAGLMIAGEVVKDLVSGV